MQSMVCGVVVAAAACGGCLQKEVGQAIYLSPSGAIWSVIERDVRSDEKDQGSRIREEQDYVLAALTGQHEVARAFRSLGGGAVTTTWLRRERPYSVLTEARFPDVRQLVMSVLREAKILGEVSLVREGCRTKLGIRIYLDAAPGSNDDSPLDALLADFEAYRIVLSGGRFVSADGFEMPGDGLVAVPDKKKTARDGILALALAWQDEGC